MSDKKNTEATPEVVYVETPVPAAPAKFDYTKLNTLAVVSLASAVSWVGSVAGIITGHIALAQIKRSGEKGRGLAIAGLVVGYLYIAGAILWAILGGLLMIRGFAGGEHFIGGNGMGGNHFGGPGFGGQGFGGQDDMQGGNFGGGMNGQIQVNPGNGMMGN
jgi:Domain of unknown function (DUF4190)